MKAVELGIDHVALPVHDALAAHDFYYGLLGLPLVETTTGDDWGGREWLMMVFRLGDGRQLALIAFRGVDDIADLSQVPADVRHLALSARTGDGRDTLAAALRGAGHRVETENHGPQTSIYFHDPSGNLLEVTAPASAEIEAPARDGASRDVVNWARG